MEQPSKMMTHYSSLMEINNQGNILRKGTLAYILEKKQQVVASWENIKKVIKGTGKKNKIKITCITKSNSTTVSNRNNR